MNLFMYYIGRINNTEINILLTVEATEVSIL